MKGAILSWAIVSMLVFWALEAKAELINRGGGLIYDTVLNVTWLQDANYAKTIGLKDSTFAWLSPGQMWWGNAGWFVGELSYFDSVRNKTWEDWRLPKVAPVNGYSWSWAEGKNYLGAVDYNAFNIGASESAFPASTCHELSFMYYINLGNLAAFDVSGSPQTGYGLINTGPFKNIQPDAYAEQYRPIDIAACAGCVQAPAFIFSNGLESDWVDDFVYVWPVRDGDVGLAAASTPVPEPATMLLLGSGLIGIIGYEVRKQIVFRNFQNGGT